MGDSGQGQSIFESETSNNVGALLGDNISDNLFDGLHIDNSVETMDAEQFVSTESLLAGTKRRSEVWKVFDLTMVDGDIKATCRHCKKSLVAGNKNGTSHLKYHIGVCPELEPSKRRKLGSPRIDLPVFDQQRSRDDFARMILGHGYPFLMAEHYYTRRFIYNLQPLFNLAHRTCLKDDCMKIYEEERLKLYDIFDKQPGRFSLTSDMWTHTEMTGYMSITAHYVDADWKLRKRLIGFAHVTVPHTGERIAQEIIDRLYNWNLDRKLFSFALDNCTVNDVVVRDLKRFLLTKKVLHLNGDMFHVRCAAHILNLIVQDGLKVIQSTIVNVRESVKYVKSSTTRKEKFKLIAQQVRAPDLSLKLDVPTRWNSTCLMLERAMKFRDAFDRLAERDSSYKFLPSADDWKHVECVTDCLQVFHDVTKKVSGTKYPTASLYFNEFCGIYLLLRKWKLSNDQFVAAMAVPMVEKFEKYWKIASKLLVVAAILDPRYKLKSIEYYYGLLYGTLAGEKIESARRCFEELFDEYASHCTKASTVASASRDFDMEVVCSAESSSSLLTTRLGLERFIHESNSTRHTKSELEIYLEDPCHPGIGDSSFDILSWWRTNGPKYPVISRIARDVLSVPLSTVASESAFSSAKRILDEYRCNLLPETIEAIMCSHDWLKGSIPDESRTVQHDVPVDEASLPTTSQEEDHSVSVPDIL